MNRMESLRTMTNAIRWSKTSNGIGIVSLQNGQLVLVIDPNLALLRCLQVIYRFLLQCLQVTYRFLARHLGSQVQKHLTLLQKDDLALARLFATTMNLFLWSTRMKSK